MCSPDPKIGESRRGVPCWRGQSFHSGRMPYTILVVDDNPTVRAIVQRIFQIAGYTALVAEDGIKALAIYAQHPVDAAIVDVDMPGPNGVEVCRMLQDEAANAKRPVLVWLMTGVVRPEIAAAAESAGALGIFAKPFTMQELIGTIEQKLHPAVAAETALAS